MVAYRDISGDWLRSPSEQDRGSLLEYTRGVIYGLSFALDKGEIRSRPVHVNRIRNAFGDLGAPALYRVGLRLLSLLGEAEELAGGYWLIAPFRLIPMHSAYAFVGCLPSSAIDDLPIRQSGLARLVDERYAADYPQQSLDGWMGPRPSSACEYLEDLLERHRASAAPALNSPETEYLRLVTRNSNDIQVLWSDKPVAILPSENLAVCRQVDVGIHRYFSAKLSSGRITTESTLRHSLPRLIWGSAFATGMPFRVSCEIAGGAARIRVPMRLPSEEYRLALLLATGSSRQGAITIYEMDADAAPRFLNELKRLGCQLEADS